MSKGHAAVTTFNGGLVSRLALARVDVARLKFAAEVQTNWLPRTVGPMMLRPGLGYLDAIVDAEVTFPIPFIFSHSDTAIIEVSDDSAVIRFRVDDALVTRATVDTAVVNGEFVDDSSWTITDTTGATTLIGSGSMALKALALGSRAQVEQAVSIAVADQTIEHGLRIEVARGPVGFALGTSSGGDELISVTELGTGTHSLAFTPNAATVYVQFFSMLRRKVIVSSVEIDDAGVLELPNPWSDSDLNTLSGVQSGDVVYVACHGVQQHKFERRSTTSWSIVLYEPRDGPFRLNASKDLSLTPSGLYGEIILTASAPLFKESMVGGLFRLFQNAQVRIADLAAGDTFTDPIRLSGVNGVDPNTNTYWNNGLTTNPIGGAPGTRSFFVSAQGTWTGTLTLQRSFDSAESGYSDIPLAPGPFATVFTDEFDNSIVWYRIGFKAGDYGSGTATIILQTPNGGGPGIVRITDILSTTSAGGQVLEVVTQATNIGTVKALSSTAPTKDWQEGDWSNNRGFPSAVSLYEGRLWWFGNDRMWGSISDSYESFNIDFPGDAGPINRSIGYGPVEVINWALPLQRLILGLQSSEASVRSSTFEAPLTPTNFGIKDCSTQGSAQVPPVKIDTRGVFVQQSRRKLYQLLYNLESSDYNANDLTALLPDIDSNLVQVAVQRQPDTVIHIVRADGKVMHLLFEPKEEVLCWSMVETDGLIERVVVLPGDAEDKVYYYINRTINGEAVRYVERFALLTDCQGGTLNHQADAYVAIDQASSATITGLDHLEAADVVVWANGKDLGIYTVAAGVITVSEAVTTAIVGLPYTANFKSAKLAYGGQMGTSLSQRKRIDHVGLILHNTHASGLEFGQSFDVMDNLPLTYQGATVDPDRVYDEFDQPMIVLPGTWNTDARLCLRATAPRPATVLGAVIGMATNEKA